MLTNLRSGQKLVRWFSRFANKSSSQSSSQSSRAIAPSDRPHSLPPQLDRLHEHQLRQRWRFVAVCWLPLPLCLWAVRHEIALMQDYFTWAALRYAIVYNRLPAFWLAFCIGTTIATLVWQSQIILFGFSPRYQRQLLQRSHHSRI